MFEGHYNEWRAKRIDKIVNIFGKDFFKNKTMLELGSGHGHIGKYFSSLGAIVTFAEGRYEHIEVLRRENPNNKIIELNQEYFWDLKTKFDIVIHWGVLYHINNWQQDLKCTLKHSNLIFLESEVCDSDDENVDLKIDASYSYDQELGEFASRPSANNIEKNIEQSGFVFTRYDDADLNSDKHIYDWKVQNTMKWGYGLRRFWILRKNV